MTESLPLRLRQCTGCNAYVWAGIAGGVLAVADPAILDLDGYRRALIGKRLTYRVLRYTDGRPWKLLDDSPGLHTPSAAVAADRKDTVAAHQCPRKPLAAVEGPPVPPQAPATPGGPLDGVPRYRVRVSGATPRSSRATPAPRPRSETRHRRYLQRKCFVCETVIGYELFAGFQRQLGLYDWVIHDRCIGTADSRQSGDGGRQNEGQGHNGDPKPSDGVDVHAPLPTGGGPRDRRTTDVQLPES